MERKSSSLPFKDLFSKFGPKKSEPAKPIPSGKKAAKKETPKKTDANKKAGKKEVLKTGSKKDSKASNGVDNIKTPKTVDQNDKSTNKDANKDINEDTTKEDILQVKAPPKVGEEQIQDTTADTQNRNKVDEAKVKNDSKIYVTGKEDSGSVNQQQEQQKVKEDAIKHSVTDLQTDVKPDPISTADDSGHNIGEDKPPEFTEVETVQEIDSTNEPGERVDLTSIKDIVNEKPGLLLSFSIETDESEEKQEDVVQQFAFTFKAETEETSDIKKETTPSEEEDKGKPSLQLVNETLQSSPQPESIEESLSSSSLDVDEIAKHAEKMLSKKVADESVHTEKSEIKPEDIEVCVRTVRLKEETPPSSEDDITTINAAENIEVHMLITTENTNDVNESHEPPSTIRLDETVQEDMMSEEVHDGSEVCMDLKEARTEKALEAKVDEIVDKAMMVAKEVLASYKEELVTTQEEVIEDIISDLKENQAESFVVEHQQEAPKITIDVHNIKEELDVGIHSVKEDKEVEKEILEILHDKEPEQEPEKPKPVVVPANMAKPDAPTRTEVISIKSFTESITLNEFIPIEPQGEAYMIPLYFIPQMKKFEEQRPKTIPDYHDKMTEITRLTVNARHQIYDIRAEMQRLRDMMKALDDPQTFMSDF